MNRLNITTFADVNGDFDIGRILLQFKYEFPDQHHTITPSIEQALGPGLSIR
jgi:hypothetical protein